jgi:hypothetical protein
MAAAARAVALLDRINGASSVRSREPVVARMARADALSFTEKSAGAGRRQALFALSHFAS